MLEGLIKYIFLFLSAAIPAVLASLRLVIDYICAIIAIAYKITDAEMPKRIAIAIHINSLSSGDRSKSYTKV